MQLQYQLQHYVRWMQETMRSWVQLPNPSTHLREWEMHQRHTVWWYAKTYSNINNIYVHLEGRLPVAIFHKVISVFINVLQYLPHYNSLTNSIPLSLLLPLYLSLSLVLSLPLSILPLSPLCLPPSLPTFFIHYSSIPMFLSLPVSIPSSVLSCLHPSLFPHSFIIILTRARSLWFVVTSFDVSVFYRMIFRYTSLLYYDGFH